MFTQALFSRVLGVAGRIVASLIVSLIILLPAVGAAEAANLRKYAGIVVDAKTGETLYAHAADAQRYPASVTKVMTLYVLFQELEAGRLTLKSKLKVSKYASQAVPTKLWLKPGSSIYVEDAIKALVTLSANDVARVIAENISGSESEFARRMTNTAKALGMMRTTYRNASGLPDSGQVTTVRDQTRLAIAIYQHFPKYYEYFQTRSFKYGKGTFGNHNRLLGQNGIDGIKTGYIRAAGYNLMTASRKGDRHLVVVAFGFDSGASRNAKVASLVKDYLPRARNGSYYRTAMIEKPTTVGGRIVVAATPVNPAPLPSFRQALMVAQAPAPQVPPAQTPPSPLAIEVASTPVAKAPFPEPRPVELMPASAVAAATQVASNPNPVAPASIQNNEPIDVIGAWIGKTLSFKPGPGNNGLVPPAPIGGTSRGNGQALDLMTSGAIGDAAPADISGWVVQIGAAPDENGAHQLLGGATGSLAGLSDYRPYVERFEKDGQVFYRARFAGFAGREQAASICDQLKKNNMSCLALQG